MEHIVTVDSFFILVSVSDGVSAYPCGDNLVDTVECAAGDEEYVLGVHLYHLLFRVFTSTLRRDIHHGAFKELEHRLLNAFARHVPCDAWVVAFSCYLVNLIDKDDAFFCCGDVIVSGLKKTHEDILHIFAHITGLSKHGGVSDGERHVKHLCYRLGHESLTRSRLPDQDEVRLLYLHLIIVLILVKAFVMVIYGDRHDAFCGVLPDDILVEERLYLYRLQQLEIRSLCCFLECGLLLEHEVSPIDALVADEPADALQQKP